MAVSEVVVVVVEEEERVVAEVVQRPPYLLLLLLLPHLRTAANAAGDRLRAVHMDERVRRRMAQC